MNEHFEKELHNVMNKEKEMSATVRSAIDQTYAQITTQSNKRKKQTIWKRTIVAACACLLAGVMLTNERVLASLTDFFYFDDKGVEEAVQHGLVTDNESSVTEEGVTISLDKYLADASTIAMNFRLLFEDVEILENAEEITLDYRLKNGDGTYITESIPDTKPLKGQEGFITSIDSENPLIDKETGEVYFDVLLQSISKNIPTLKDAVIEVESVNIFSESGLIKQEGVWNIAVMNEGEEKVRPLIDYVMKEEDSSIQVLDAQATSTAFHLTFAVDGLYGDDENKFANRMTMIDENGSEITSHSGFRIVEKGKQTIITTTFPITSCDNLEQVTFIVKGLDEIILQKR